MKVWVVVDIGCIECGADNEEPVVGVFATKAAADARLVEIRAEYERTDAHNERLGYRRQLRDQTNGFGTSDSQARLVAARVVAA